MKKKYIVPTVDFVVTQVDEHLMKHSNDWADAKGGYPDGVWGDDQDPNDDQIKNRNLWDD